MRHVEAAVSKLAAEQRIPADVERELRDAIAADAPSQVQETRNKLIAEIVGYLGAALVVVAIALLISSRWAAWNSVTRQAVLVVVAGALLGAQRAIGTSTDTKRRLAGVLGTASIVPAAAWPAVGLLPPWDGRVWPWVAFGVAVYSYTAARTLIGNAAMVVTSAILIPSMLSQFNLDHEVGTTGGLFVLLGSAWLVVSAQERVDEPELSAFAGSALILLGSQMPIMEFGGSYPLFAVAALIAGTLIYSYLNWVRRFPVLAAGVVGLGIVCGETVYKLTGGNVFGAALGLLVAGVVMLVVSLRIVRQTKKDIA